MSGPIGQLIGESVGSVYKDIADQACAENERLRGFAAWVREYPQSDAEHRRRAATALEG